MIVAFTGGRDYSNDALAKAIIDIVRHLRVYARVGDCTTGADLMVRRHMRDTYGIFNADRGRYGKRAGPRRNADMLRGRKAYGAVGPLADLLIAFPGGKDTADCVRQARKLGIPVVEIPA